MGVGVGEGVGLAIGLGVAVGEGDGSRVAVTRANRGTRVSTVVDTAGDGVGLAGSVRQPTMRITKSKVKSMPFISGNVTLIG